jgi:hypothetical protein
MGVGVARYRWRDDKSMGTWCATRREVLIRALDCGRAMHDPQTGKMALLEGVSIEVDQRDRAF